MINQDAKNLKPNKEIEKELFHKIKTTIKENKKIINTFLNDESLQETSPADITDQILKADLNLKRIQTTDANKNCYNNIVDNNMNVNGYLPWDLHDFEDVLNTINLYPNFVLTINDTISNIINYEKLSLAELVRLTCEIILLEGKKPLIGEILNSFPSLIETTRPFENDYVETRLNFNKTTVNDAIDCLKYSFGLNPKKLINFIDASELIKKKYNINSFGLLKIPREKILPATFYNKIYGSFVTNLIKQTDISIVTGERNIKNIVEDLINTINLQYLNLTPSDIKYSVYAEQSSIRSLNSMILFFDKINSNKNNNKTIPNSDVDILNSLIINEKNLLRLYNVKPSLYNISNRLKIDAEIKKKYFANSKTVVTNVLGSLKDNIYNLNDYQRVKNKVELILDNDRISNEQINYVESFFTYNKKIFNKHPEISPLKPELLNHLFNIIKEQSFVYTEMICKKNINFIRIINNNIEQLINSTSTKSLYDDHRLMFHNLTPTQIDQLYADKVNISFALDLTYLFSEDNFDPTKFNIVVRNNAIKLHIEYLEEVILRQTAPNQVLYFADINSDEFTAIRTRINNKKTPEEKASLEGKYERLNLQMIAVNTVTLALKFLRYYEYEDMTELLFNRDELFNLNDYYKIEHKKFTDKSYMENIVLINYLQK